MIPGIVHRIWFGPRPMRRELVEYGRAWERLGYELRLWTETNLPDLVNREVYDQIGLRGVNSGGGDPELGVWVQRADIVSYELLWRFGGIYANTDIEPLRPIPLDGVVAFAGFEDDTFLCNALMGCVPDNDFFRLVVNEIPHRYARHWASPMNYTTGPHLLTDVWKRNPGGLTTFPREAFYPVGFAAESMRSEWDDHPDSYTVHHWGHTRARWSEEPTDAFLDARFG